MGGNCQNAVGNLAFSPKTVKSNREMEKAVTMKLITWKRQLLLGFCSVLLLGMLVSSILVFRLTPAQIETRRYHSKLKCAATEVSQLFRDKDQGAIESALRTLVQRNSEVLSAGLRDAEGSLLAQVGSHDKVWADPDLVSLRLATPIQVGDTERRVLELCFKGDATIRPTNPVTRNVVVAVLAVAILYVVSLYVVSGWMLRPAGGSELLAESSDVVGRARDDADGQHEANLPRRIPRKLREPTQRSSACNNAVPRRLDVDHPVGGLSVSDLQVCGEYLLEQIETLLDLSIDDCNGNPRELLCDSLHEQMECTVAELRYLADTKGLRLSYSFHGNLPQRVFIDPVRLRQAIRILIGTAIECTDVGGVSVVSRPSCEGDGCLAIDVVDNAIGLSGTSATSTGASSQPEVSATMSFCAAGFGQSVARHLVERMGAELAVHRTLDDHTCTTITIGATPTQGH